MAKNKSETLYLEEFIELIGEGKVYKEESSVLDVDGGQTLEWNVLAKDIDGRPIVVERIFDARTVFRTLYWRKK